MRLLTPRLDMIAPKNWMIGRPKYNRLQLKEIEILLERKIWVTSDRTLIPIKKMNVNHIQNVINAWTGKGKSHIPVSYLGGRAKWLKLFNEELTARKA